MLLHNLFNRRTRQREKERERVEQIIRNKKKYCAIIYVWISLNAVYQINGSSAGHICVTKNTQSNDLLATDVRQLKKFFFNIFDRKITNQHLNSLNLLRYRRSECLVNAKMKIATDKLSNLLCVMSKKHQSNKKCRLHWAGLRFNQKSWWTMLILVD